jgi:acetoacetate decarboxylase
MDESEVRRRAFAMPLTSPAYPIGPYRFFHREFLIITYSTDLRKLRELVPAPLEVVEPLAKFEFIRMPDYTGFGDYIPNSACSVAARPGSCGFANSRNGPRVTKSLFFQQAI